MSWIRSSGDRTERGTISWISSLTAIIGAGQVDLQDPQERVENGLSEEKVLL